MKRFIGICLLSCTFVNPSMADSSDNECANFHIQISNLTKMACVLTSQRVIHGNLITPPPMSILPNDSKRFDMNQTIYGPAITLSYQCGSENISFTSQQNVCVLEAGDITGSILHPVPININARYAALSGSYFWQKSGSINWSIITEMKD